MLLRYVTWLRELWPTLTAPVLVLCTDDPQRALSGGLGGYHPILLPSRLRAMEELWGAAHAACDEALTDGALKMRTTLHSPPLTSSLPMTWHTDDVAPHR